jgi:hypothetical protein
MRWVGGRVTLVYVLLTHIKWVRAAQERVAWPDPPLVIKNGLLCMHQTDKTGLFCRVQQKVKYGCSNRNFMF